MCGIAGFSGRGNRSDLLAMAQTLVHRGPDGEGYFEEPETGVYLAHRRLAILDIDGGRQPMWNEDGTVCVVFNGEIYNHPELRRELISLGHVFRSDHSDTEVLVHGYEEWGDGLPHRLNGMFAFAVLERGRRLFLARDRFGEKPLYYVDKPGLFAFASEVGALLKHSGVDSSLNPRAIQKYFAYGLIPAPLSLYGAIRKLPAGWRLSCDLATGLVRATEYWRFSIEPYEARPGDSEEGWAEELQHLLQAAVRRRLISDVPLGVFLSGGIDSSCVLAFARQQLTAQHAKSFAIGFHEPTYDESHYARAVARHLGTDHHEEILSLEAARDLIPEVLGRVDEPIADSSILPTYLLCRFARQRVTVALGGDGGDELFAGYDPFDALRPAALYRRLVPDAVHRIMRAGADWLPIHHGNMSFDFKVRRALRGVSFPPRFWNPVWLGSLEPKEIDELFNGHFDPEDLYSEALAVWESSSADNIIDRTLEFYTRIYLPDDILTKVDRASMMVSMEVRAPFLDTDLVEFVRRLPNWVKYRRGARKVLLKKALRGVVPDEVIDRKKKGFGIPLLRWLKDWKEPPRGLDRNLVRSEWVAQRWDEHLSGKFDHRHFLWSWIALGYHLASSPAR